MTRAALPGDTALYRQVGEDAWIAVAPVTLAEWGEFVRMGRYFDARFWGLASPPSLRHGDEVLRRVGFRWPLRNRPVGCVAWEEARAFCESRGGRLPWSSEWDRVDALPPLAVGLAAGLAEKVAARFDVTRTVPGPGGLLIAPAFDEWCEDWFHPAAKGPPQIANPAPPGGRRVRGIGIGVAPRTQRPDLGFRLVLRSARIVRAGLPYEGFGFASPR